MKTADLAGDALDAVVARLEGRASGAKGTDADVHFSPSTDWATAGQIIEKLKIHIAPMPGKGWVWCAIVVAENERSAADRGTWMEGRTPLVAAMRAYVVSRLGDEVSLDLSTPR